MTYAEIMANSAALLNDVPRQLYTNAVLLPFLNQASDELQTAFELNNIPVTNVVSLPITIEAGVTELTKEPAVPVTDVSYYPADLVEIQQLWEQWASQTYSYIPMTRVDFLPKQDQPVSNLIFWTWQEQKIKFIGANTNIVIKLDYIKSLFPTIAIADVDNENTLMNTNRFLWCKCAALASVFLGEDPERAQLCQMQASDALDITLGISTKGRQAISTRRRPFLASYKLRGVR